MSIKNLRVFLLLNWRHRTHPHVKVKIHDKSILVDGLDQDEVDDVGDKFKAPKS